MKKQILLSFTLLLFITGCKKEETTEPETTVPEEAVQPEVVIQKECYAFEADDSQIELYIEHNGNEATGTLTYALAEKDKNTGTFKGKIQNNILLADYTFQSEGIESTRQVAFQFRGNQCLEAFGEMTDNGTKFKDVTKLDFTSSMPLAKVECPK